MNEALLTSKPKSFVYQLVPYFPFVILVVQFVLLPSV